MKFERDTMYGLLGLIFVQPNIGAVQLDVFLPSKEGLAIKFADAIVTTHKRINKKGN